LRQPVDILLDQSNNDINVIIAIFGEALNYLSVQKSASLVTTVIITRGDFTCGGGPRQEQKGGPLVTSSYSANSDKHFWSGLRYGHPRIRFLDYDMTDTAEGENAKRCSW